MSLVTYWDCLTCTILATTTTRWPIGLSWALVAIPTMVAHLLPIVHMSVSIWVGSNQSNSPRKVNIPFCLSLQTIRHIWLLLLHTTCKARTQIQRSSSSWSIAKEQVGISIFQEQVCWFGISTICKVHGITTPPITAPTSCVSTSKRRMVSTGNNAKMVIWDVLQTLIQVLKTWLRLYLNYTMAQCCPSKISSISRTIRAHWALFIEEWAMSKWKQT